MNVDSNCVFIVIEIHDLLMPLVSMLHSLWQTGYSKPNRNRTIRVHEFIWFISQ